MNGWRAFFAVLAFAVCASAQITVTPTLISAQVGTSLYCAARASTTVAGGVQVYCYSTNQTTWDTLEHNSIDRTPDSSFGWNTFDPVNDKAPSSPLHFQFQLVAGVIQWQVAICSVDSNGVKTCGTSQSGHF